MPALITDTLTRVSDSNNIRPVIATLASPGKAIAATSLTISDATGWTTTTAIHFAIYTTMVVGGVTIKDATSQTDWKGTLSGTTISNLTITGGSDRAYTAGAIVELTPTAKYAKDTYDWGIAQHNVLGGHTAITSTSINNSGAFNQGGNYTQSSGTFSVPVGSVTTRSLSNPYKFSAYLSADITPGSGQRIQFNAESFDTNNNFDIVTTKGRYTAPVDGYYQLNVLFAQAATGANQDMGGNMLKNGGVYLGTATFVNMYVGDTHPQISLTVLIKLLAGDYVDVILNNPYVCISGVGNTTFSGFLVSAL